jgi:hypothetical protein
MENDEQWERREALGDHYATLEADNARHEAIEDEYNAHRQRHWDAQCDIEVAQGNPPAT